MATVRKIIVRKEAWVTWPRPGSRPLSLSGTILPAGSQGFRDDLRQCLPLKIHVRLREAHCDVDICTAEPLAENRKTDSAFQTIDRGRVAQGVRVQPFAQPRLSASKPLWQIFVQQIANPKPGERFTTAVLE